MERRKDLLAYQGLSILQQAQKTQQQKSLYSRKVGIGRLGMKPYRSHTQRKKQKGKTL